MSTGLATEILESILSKMDVSPPVLPRERKRYLHRPYDWPPKEGECRRTIPMGQKTSSGRRRAAIAKLGGKCVRCGFDDIRALQIDHINGGGSKEHRAIGGMAIYQRILDGQEGYQVLCANCNWIKRAENDENF